mmetsp:Transcript_47110/g.111035  ORF Transcript_47110/g.111035 Transcript_47110/m.111035 type:complete len:250 (+) Transcript_47110:128-877(+)
MSGRALHLLLLSMSVSASRTTTKEESEKSASTPPKSRPTTSAPRATGTVMMASMTARKEPEILLVGAFLMGAMRSGPALATAITSFTSFFSSFFCSGSCSGVGSGSLALTSSFFSAAAGFGASAFSSAGGAAGAGFSRTATELLCMGCAASAPTTLLPFFLPIVDTFASSASTAFAISVSSFAPLARFPRRVATKAKTRAKKPFTADRNSIKLPATNSLIVSGKDVVFSAVADRSLVFAPTTTYCPRLA